MTIRQPRPGDEFVHASVLDPDYVPGPGEKHSAAPKARMKITAVRAGSVYFTYAADSHNRAAWTLPLEIWCERYGTPEP